MNEPVSLILTNSQSLVLFDWLASFDETGMPPPIDSAVQAVLWKLEGMLEKQLTEVLKPNYTELVISAKRELTNE